MTSLLCKFYEYEGADTSINFTRLPQNVLQALHFLISIGRISGSGTEIRPGGGAGMRGCEAADYPHKVSACEGYKLGGLKPP